MSERGAISCRFRCEGSPRPRRSPEGEGGERSATSPSPSLNRGRGRSRGQKRVCVATLAAARSKRSKSDAEEEEEEKEGNLRSLSQTSAGSSKRRPSRPPPLRHHRSPLHAASGRAAEALPRPAAIDLRSAPPVTLTFPGFQLFDNPLHHLSARRSGIKPAASSGGAAHVIKAEPLSWRPRMRSRRSQSLQEVREGGHVDRSSKTAHNLSGRPHLSDR